MSGSALKGPRYRTGVIAAAAIAIAVVATGCGGAQAPQAVRLALTAPTDGASVTVRNLKVFGTVDPRSATVVVAGRRAHVAHGAFARWLVLRRGLSRIKIVATAAGYAPADLNITVRSSPSASATRASTRPAPSSRGNAAANSTPPPAGTHYSPAVQATYLRACNAAAGSTPAAAASCRCGLSYLEARVSQRTLEVTERAILNGQATVPQWMRDAALACRRG
jgi:hypothetical protein